MPEITEDDRERARVLLDRLEIGRRGPVHQRMVLEQALAEQRTELTAAYEAGYEGLRADIAERIRLACCQAWNDGYDACRQGEQRHNPYRAPRPEVTP